MLRRLTVYSVGDGGWTSPLLARMLPDATKAPPRGMLGPLSARKSRLASPRPQERGSLEVLGMWFGRHTSVYAFGSLINLVLALVQITVVTRFLKPSEYGRAGLLLLF